MFWETDLFQSIFSTYFLDHRVPWCPEDGTNPSSCKPWPVSCGPWTGDPQRPCMGMGQGPGGMGMGGMGMGGMGPGGMGMDGMGGMGGRGQGGELEALVMGLLGMNMGGMGQDGMGQQRDRPRPLECLKSYMNASGECAI